MAWYTILKEIEIFPLQKIWRQFNQAKTQIQIEANWIKQMNFIESEREDSYWNNLAT